MSNLPRSSDFEECDNCGGEIEHHLPRQYCKECLDNMTPKSN